MGEIREMAWNHVAGDKTASVTASENKYINKIRKLKQEYPDDVDIYVENKDGSIVAHIPEKWLKIRPTKRMNIAQEVTDARRERMRDMARRRKEDTGGVCQT